jgi:uncharacterized protein DUF3634
VAFLWVVLAFVLVCLPFALALRRATELFVVRVRDGRATFVRGRIPQSLLDDISEVVKEPPVRRARLHAVRRGGRAVLVAQGELGSQQKQRLRNVVGQYPLQRIAAGGRPGRRAR